MAVPSELADPACGAAPRAVFTRPPSVCERDVSHRAAGEQRDACRPRVPRDVSCLNPSLPSVRTRRRVRVLVLAAGEVRNVKMCLARPHRYRVPAGLVYSFPVTAAGDGECALEASCTGGYSLSWLRRPILTTPRRPSLQANTRSCAGSRSPTRRAAGSPRPRPSSRTSCARRSSSSRRAKRRRRSRRDDDERDGTVVTARRAREETRDAGERRREPGVPPGSPSSSFSAVEGSRAGGDGSSAPSRGIL